MEGSLESPPQFDFYQNYCGVYTVPAGIIMIIYIEFSSAFSGILNLFVLCCVTYGSTFCSFLDRFNSPFWHWLAFIDLYLYFVPLGNKVNRKQKYERVHKSNVLDRRVFTKKLLLALAVNDIIKTAFYMKTGCKSYTQVFISVASLSACGPQRTRRN